MATTPITYTLDTTTPPAVRVDPVLALAAEAAFAACGTDETYSAVDAEPATVRVLVERGQSQFVPGGPRGATVTDNRTRVHFLRSEVGRPQRGATVTDGAALHTIDAIESDDGIEVVCLVK